MTDAAPLVIVYHADCLDGAASAWVVAKSKRLDKAPQRAAAYIPYGHHDAAPSESAILAALQDRTAVYFVDVAPERAFLDILMNDTRVSSVRILDHHASAAEKLKGYPRTDRLDIDIDPARSSAAAMVWQRLLAAEAAPDILRMVDKMDGSAKGLKTLDDFAAAAHIDTHDIGTIAAAFDALQSLAAMTFAQMAQAGGPLVTAEDKKIDRLLTTAQFVSLQLAEGAGAVSVPIVQAHPAEYGRRISTRLVELGKNHGVGVALAWARQDNGAVSVSIRSDGEPDASKIAGFLAASMNIGGGGHADAAAIHFADLDEFSQKMNIALPA